MLKIPVLQEGNRRKTGRRKYVKYVKALRRQWAGHIMRRTRASMVKRVTQWILLWSTRRCRLKKRWREKIEGDMKAVGVKDLRAKCRERIGLLK